MNSHQIKVIVLKGLVHVKQTLTQSTWLQPPTLSEHWRTLLAVSLTLILSAGS